MHFQGLKLDGVFFPQLFIMKPGFIWLEHVSYLTSSAVQGTATALRNHSRSWKEKAGFFAGYTCVT